MDERNRFGGFRAFSQAGQPVGGFLYKVLKNN
jgi:hypothetical protein